MTQGDRLGLAADFLRRPRSGCQAFLLSFAVAALYVLAQFDLRFLAGTSPYWQNPVGILNHHDWADMVAALAGYRYFVQGAWSYPIFHVPELGLPGGSNIVLTDSVPLLAMLGRLIFHLTGADVNLFGVWTAACFAGSAMSLTWLVRSLGQRSLAAALAASLFGLSMPILLQRWGHLSLMPQCGVTLCLICYASFRRHFSPLKFVVCAGVLGAALLWIHAYLFVMGSGILAASLVQAVLDRRIGLSMARVVAGALVILYLGLMGKSGYFDHAGSVGAEGFGIFSMNLLSPIIPQRTGLFPSAGDLVIDGTGGQYEGFAYLGGGVLLLVAASWPEFRRLVVGAARRNGVLLAVLCGFLGLALSNQIYFGAWKVLGFGLPDGVARLLSVFRASGRFCWPVIYAVTAFAIVATLRRFPRAGLLWLAVAVWVQWVDAGHLRAAMAKSLTAPAPLPLAFEPLRAALAGSSMLLVHPSIGCLPDLPVWRARAALEFESVGALANLPTNSVHETRRGQDCAAEGVLASPLPPPPGEVDIFLPERPGFAPAAGCGAGAHMVICAASPATRAALLALDPPG